MTYDKRYKCTACSNATDGDFIFTVEYTETEEGYATRCPKCGALAMAPDVKQMG